MSRDHWYPYGTNYAVAPVNLEGVDKETFYDISTLLPEPHVIPDMFITSQSDDPGIQKWLNFFKDWFYSTNGLRPTKLVPKKGINAGSAWTTLGLIAKSTQVTHEYKEAAFAYLASSWLIDVEYESL